MGDRHSTAVNRKCWFNFPFESAISAILPSCASLVCVDVIEDWPQTRCVWDLYLSWQTLASASRFQDAWTSLHVKGPWTGQRHWPLASP